MQSSSSLLDMFLYSKRTLLTSTSLPRAWIVSFDFRKVFRRLVEVRRVRFDNRNVCLRLEEVWIVRFDFRRASTGLCRSSYSPFLTSVKHVEGVWKFCGFVLKPAKCVGDL